VIVPQRITFEDFVVEIRGQQMVASLVCLAPAASPTSPNAEPGEIYAKDGVAINGYDVISYFVEKRATKGSAQFSVNYKGARFYFSSEKHRDIFAGDPVRYAPQYGGYCALGMAKGYKAPSEPEAFTIVDEKLYINYDSEVLDAWCSDSGTYIEKADTNWRALKSKPAL
jgi:YHS domain-containing protein